MTSSLEDIKIFCEKNNLRFSSFEYLKEKFPKLEYIWHDYSLKETIFDEVIYGTTLATSFTHVDGIAIIDENLTNLESVKANFNYLTMCKSSDECLDKISKNGTKHLTEEEWNILNNIDREIKSEIIKIDLENWNIELEAISIEYKLNYNILIENKKNGFKYLWIDTSSSNILAYTRLDNPDKVEPVESFFKKPTKRPIILDLDIILDKISDLGIDSLTEEERSFLKEESSKY